MKKLYVIGSPIQHSLSPVIHNAGLKELGLEADYSYDRMEVDIEALPDFVERLRNGEIHGASVTMPNKMAIIPHLDKFTPEARDAGAVNTIYAEDGAVIGHNTDGNGLLKALTEEDVAVTGKSVLLIGAGGAARSIAVTLARTGTSSIIIVNRGAGRAEELALTVGDITGNKVETAPLSLLPDMLDGTDILINASSIGMKGVDAPPLLSAGYIPSHLIVIDIIYKPLKTKLLAQAEKAGAKAVNGTSMLVHQAAGQFKVFTGRDAPLDAMKRALSEVLDETDG